MKDEDFWRDVGSRTLATVFAAGIVYVFALSAGYVGRPSVLDALSAVAITIGPIFVGLALGAVFNRAKRTRALRDRPWIPDLINWAVMAVGLGCAVYSIYRLVSAFT
jgi:hypothetical protein